MSLITAPPVLDSTGKEIVNKLDEIKSALSGDMTGTVYGFFINGSESDPYEMVSYVKDAVGMTPAYMDYAKGEFNYGSWANAFFMPKPCMLNYDGTVAYYLDPNDYTKKADGTASGVANTSFAGNAMMEWGQNGKKIWYKVEPTSQDSAFVYIADHKAGAGFHDWSFHGADGKSHDHFYTPIYNGSLISDKLRSISGQTVSNKLTGTQEIEYAKANNTGSSEIWNIECLADRELINFLLILMGKSVDTQTVFGQGANSGGSEAANNTFKTGVHNTKGLFYGTNSGSVASNSFANCVKVFGMENWYGFQWRRMNGHMLVSGTQKIKLTYGIEDGSSVAGYNETGDNYISLGLTPSGTSGGYISKMAFNQYGMFQHVSSGAANIFYCDGQWFDNGISAFAIVGGVSNARALVGALCSYLTSAVSGAGWDLGAALSCKPLA